MRNLNKFTIFAPLAMSLAVHKHNQHGNKDFYPFLPLLQRREGKS